MGHFLLPQLWVPRAFYTSPKALRMTDLLQVAERSHGAGMHMGLPSLGQADCGSALGHAGLGWTSYHRTRFPCNT